MNKYLVVATIEGFGYLECTFPSHYDAMVFEESLKRATTSKTTSNRKDPIVKVRLLEEVEQ